MVLGSTVCGPPPTLRLLESVRSTYFFFFSKFIKLVFIIIRLCLFYCVNIFTDGVKAGVGKTAGIKAVATKCTSNNVSSPPPICS